MTAVDITEQQGVDIKKWAGWIVGIGIWFLPLLGMDFNTYMVLTIAGLSMGMLMFLTASGFSLIFGLMDVLNLAHGAFFAFGAYASYTLLSKFGAYGLVEGASLAASIAIFVLALIASVVIGLIIGFVLEKIIIRRVYGDHLKQILITMGANMVMLQILILIWGPNEDFVPIPGAFDGSFMMGDVVVSKFRVVAIIVGLIVLAAIQWVMTRTKLGIIVRAGVENPETVQTIGYNINRIFTGVFIVGAALAALGGSMFTMYKMTVYPHCGDEYMIFALIVVIIGGLGSITGCFYGALMVGLAFNYVAFLAPQLALGTNIAIMLIVLLIKPKGLMGK